MSIIKTAAAALALPGLLAVAVPASAAAYGPASVSTQTDSWQHGRHKSRYDRHDYGRRGYAEPHYRDRRDSRDYDRRYDCRRKSGTTGLILGGAAGALLGREIDGGRDRTLGTIAGAAGGALLGREVDRGGSRCR